MVQLSPDELGQLQTRKRQIRERYNLGVAQQDYLSRITQREHGRQLGDLTRKFDQVRERLPWAYAARGTLNSGIYNKALGRYATERNAVTTNAELRLRDQLEGYDLAKQQLGQVQAGGLLDVEELEKNRLATIASMINTFG